MKLYCGIDLHSNNHVIVVIDQNDTRIIEKRVPNDLRETLRILNPFVEHLSGVAIESTFNWYWLVDGLMDAGYPVMLVNTTAVKKYEGLKHADDQHDAFWLAHLMRLNILPTGYIYPKEDRGIRDLLRLRQKLVQQRTSLVLSGKSHFERLTGRAANGAVLQRPSAADIYLSKLTDPAHRLRLESQLKLIRTLTLHIEHVEQEVFNTVKQNPTFRHLQTVPGIGKILGLTITLETGDIRRFPTVGDYASYCRCVAATQTSNGKKKAEGNRKNGNRYLGWAYIEAAAHALSNCDPARRFYDRKKAKRNAAVAMKALAHKLARASYFVVRDEVDFDVNKLFG